jgi:hypothetical protein
MDRTPDLNFRPAQPVDVLPAVELIHLSHGEFGTALFGLGDPTLERQILSGLFVQHGSALRTNGGGGRGGKVVGLLGSARKSRRRFTRACSAVARIRRAPRLRFIRWALAVAFSGRRGDDGGNGGPAGCRGGASRHMSG